MNRSGKIHNEKQRHRLPQEPWKNWNESGVGRRKRLPHIHAQGLPMVWRRRFRLRTDFFTGSHGRGSVTGTTLTMLRVEKAAWDTMVSHAEKTFPKECCGVMLGTDGVVHKAVPLANVYTGPQEDFFVMDPLDLHRVDVEGRKEGFDVLGVFHSHPDCDAYFSKRDLENSCSWFSYVVLSIKNGRFDHANSYRPDFDQKEAPKEELIYG